MGKKTSKFLLFPLEKIKFKLKDKTETIYKIPSLIAYCIGGTILVDKLFEGFSSKEKESLIFHEKYHKRFFNWVLFGIKSLFNKKYNAKQLEEFAADRHAAKENEKVNMINVLKTIEKLVKDRKIKYNYKNHPTIKERIDALKKLK